MKDAVGLRRIHGHLLLALLGLFLARPEMLTNLLGSGLVVIGMALRVWAAGLLEKGGDLCADGPYRHVRHPLYLGSLISAIGFCVMMKVVWGWVVVLPLFAVLYAIQVSLEERHLQIEYGQKHSEYAAAVPKLIPRFRTGRMGVGRRWSLARVLTNREQYHIVVTLILAALFYAKGHWGW